MSNYFRVLIATIISTPIQILAIAVLAIPLALFGTKINVVVDIKRCL